MTNQDIIRERYAAELAEAKERLCGTCNRGLHDRQGWHCWTNGFLLPLTTKGEDCPYWRKLVASPQAPQAPE